MTNADDNVYPISEGMIDKSSLHGLTKREYFAAMAMQGIIAANKKIEYGDHGKQREMELIEIVQDAVWAADHLINVLNKQP